MRGAALVAMIVYHFAWDPWNFFGYATEGMTRETGLGAVLRGALPRPSCFWSASASTSPMHKASVSGPS